MLVIEQQQLITSPWKHTNRQTPCNYLAYSSLYIQFSGCVKDQHTRKIIMQSPNRKPAQKGLKSITQQTAVSSTSNRGILKNSTLIQRPSSSSNSGVSEKSMIKENTRPLEFRLHTQQRAAQRAIFNSSVATKVCIVEQYKKQVEKVLKVVEEEEVRTMRKEMIPRAQLMPLFDRPFLPQRSRRPLTVPREPSFLLAASKESSGISC